MTATEEVRKYNPEVLVGAIDHPKFHVVIKFPKIISVTTHRPVMGWGANEEEAAREALSQFSPRPF